MFVCASITIYILTDDLYRYEQNFVQKNNGKIMVSKPIQGWVRGLISGQLSNWAAKYRQE